MANALKKWIKSRWEEPMTKKAVSALAGLGVGALASKFPEWQIAINSVAGALGITAIAIPQKVKSVTVPKGDF